MHKDLAEKAISILKEFPESIRLIFYGSVYRGDYRPDSDIDIAFICDDTYRGFLLDPIGDLIGLDSRIKESLSKLHNPQQIEIHVNVHWESNYLDGVLLTGKEGFSPGYLHNEGVEKYNLYEDLD